MKLHHIGIAVNSIEEGVALYESLGFKMIERAQVEAFNVDVAMLDAGGARLELLAPTGPGGIQKFLEKNGPGIHHTAYEVADIKAELARLKSEGFRLIDETPRPGFGDHLVAFIHPKSTMGTLTELVQA